MMDFVEEIYTFYCDTNVPFFLHFQDCIIVITMINVSDKDVSKGNIPENLQVLVKPEYDPISINIFSFDPKDYESVSMKVHLDLPKTPHNIIYIEKCLDEWFDKEYTKNVLTGVFCI